MPLSTSAGDYIRQQRMEFDSKFSLTPTIPINSPQTSFSSDMRIYKSAGRSLIQRAASQFTNLVSSCRVCRDVNTVKPPVVPHYPN
jgi:hypothetical protein